MSWFGKLTRVVAALAAGLAGASSAYAEWQGAPPPHLSLVKGQYYKAHPQEWAALLSRLPKASDAKGVVVNPPAPPPVVGGTWTPVATPFPSSLASAPQLLMDGTVLVHSGCSRNWWKLTPDAFGNYATGTWSAIAPMPTGYTPLYFAQQVLTDGRFIVNGGEYINCSASWSNLGAIYDPVANSWTSVAPPPGWGSIGDAQSVVLRDRTYMLANCCTSQQAKFDQTTLTWTNVGTGKNGIHNEENWSLLPNGKVITADAYVGLSPCGRNLEIFEPVTNVWSSAGTSPVQLSDCVGASTHEVGPHVVRPNGDVVFFSGVTDGTPSGTAVYNTYSTAIVAGPSIPAVNGANPTLADAPAALLPSGRILLAASPGAFQAPTTFFEYTLGNLVAKTTNQTPNAPSVSSYEVNLLVLPTGQVLQTDFSNSVQLYNPTGSPASTWRPALTSSLTTLTRGATKAVSGTQLNGRSEGGFYGDDAQSSTNFPLFRVTNNATGHVFYCRTTYQNNRGIRSGQSVNARFFVPLSLETGPSTLEVVANGIASAPIAVTVN